MRLNRYRLPGKQPESRTAGWLQVSCLEGRTGLSSHGLDLSAACFCLGSTGPGQLLWPKCREGSRPIPPCGDWLLIVLVFCSWFLSVLGTGFYAELRTKGENRNRKRIWVSTPGLSEAELWFATC